MIAFYSIVHGAWSSWSTWGACSASCGGGQARRFRVCDAPAPRDHGRPCVGASQDTQLCNMHTCEGMVLSATICQ